MIKQMVGFSLPKSKWAYMGPDGKLKAGRNIIFPSYPSRPSLKPKTTVGLLLRRRSHSRAWYYFFTDTTTFFVAFGEFHDLGFV